MMMKLSGKNLYSKASVCESHYQIRSFHFHAIFFVFFFFSDLKSTFQKAFYFGGSDSLLRMFFFIFILFCFVLFLIILFYKLQCEKEKCLCKGLVGVRMWLIRPILAIRVLRFYPSILLHLYSSGMSTFCTCFLTFLMFF